MCVEPLLVPGHCNALKPKKNQKKSLPQDERDSHSGALLQCRHQLAELREQHDKHMLEVTADTKTQAATAHEERARERNTMKEQHER